SAVNSRSEFCDADAPCWGSPCGVRAPGGRTHVDALSCKNRPVLRYVRAGAVAKRKETDSQSDPQSDLPFSCSPDTSRTLEIRCGNCGAKFIGFYGTEEDAGTETVDTE